MKPAQAAKALFEPISDLVETGNNQLLKPMADEAFSEVFGFKKGLSKNSQEIASEDLRRARDKQKLEEEGSKDNQVSQESAAKIIAAFENIYKAQETKTNKEQQLLKEEVLELQTEITKLAKAAGVETKAHLEATPKKISVLFIKLLTMIVRTLRIKAEESKSAQELVAQRSNAKPATGMLAWVSGKQMKIHEQGTLQLQG